MLNMKRLVLLALFAFAFVCTSFADGWIRYVSGDKRFFKTAEGKALLEFVWDGATYDNKRPLREQWPDLDKYIFKARDGFLQDFTKRSEKVEITENPAEANYKIRIRIYNVDRYIKMTGLIPGPSTKVWGILKILDMESDEELLVIRLDEVEGGASPSPFESMSDTFEYIGKKLAGFK